MFSILIQNVVVVAVVEEVTAKQVSSIPKIVTMDTTPTGQGKNGLPPMKRNFRSGRWFSTRSEIFSGADRLFSETSKV